jgi:hypothetical protein
MMNLPRCVSAAGSGDGFLEVQLKPEAFQAAADAVNTCLVGFLSDFVFCRRQW